jgi:glycosyltransferase involved in cell wall biosynthesis
LLSALNGLSTQRPVTSLAFGRGDLPPAGRPGDTIRSLGFLDDPARQALVYSAADMFVLPSLEDNLPQTGLESLACGTPVIGFEAGGIPELIEDGRTGLLAATGDGRALARCIDLLADNPALGRRMACEARSFAVRNYDDWLHAQRHIGLYECLRAEVMPASPNVRCW